MNRLSPTPMTAMPGGAPALRAGIAESSCRSMRNVWPWLASVKTTVAVVLPAAAARRRSCCVQGASRTVDSRAVESPR